MKGLAIESLSQSWLEVSQWDEWVLRGIPGPLLEFHISYAIFRHQFVKNQNPDNHVNLVKREEKGEHVHIKIQPSLTIKTCSYGLQRDVYFYKGSFNLWFCSILICCNSTVNKNIWICCYSSYFCTRIVIIPIFQESISKCYDFECQFLTLQQILILNINKY